VRPRAASHHAQNHPHGGQNIERNVFDLVRDREALPTEVPVVYGNFIPSSLAEPRAGPRNDMNGGFARFDRRRRRVQNCEILHGDGTFGEDIDERVVRHPGDGAPMPRTI
jgi:hypothetical protein